ncbi:protein adenylyltransferase SelO [Saccharibacillus alkalitolerans]|uniref:Protein nucleotidyltransferase YdiU n=1 Tax=Saccharibacillus alkalitolerans TaxID=2705290 RepID=A0ABX0F8W7_9BACL|nr:YdiU family protein [Saccharibacillus alkalitolerans]NGZ76459.1 YdiU family protein [Saccharibacillus alkalitolerans]
MTDISVNRTAGWNFDNSYARLPNVFYSQLPPVPVQEPKAAFLNDKLAAELGLDPEWLHGEEAAAIFAGNALPEGAEPLAQAYAGHQFGGFTKLGDGRAILLGEQLTPDGRRVDIQLKGSGRTPFSRGGDGRAALGPMLREYIISEAMHALGIPTTRSLAVMATGENIRREKPLPGAVLTRVAASHLRVGTFQYALQWGGVDALRELADYAIGRHYPEIDAADQAASRREEAAAGTGAEGRYARFLHGVMERQAALIAQWMLAGFIHGVMNTDNMTISGESIDYGPCAFMDAYDPSTVFSSIDTGGRYAYGNQPPIALWNLTRLAETLVPLLDEDQDRGVEIAQGILGGFERMYLDTWFDGMRAKLGLTGREEEDERLIADLLDLMKAFRADYTNTFVGLTFDAPASGAGEAETAGAARSDADAGATPDERQDAAGNAELDYAGLDEASGGSGSAGAGASAAVRPTSFPGADALLSSGEYRAWRARWEERLIRQGASAAEVRERMLASNPAVIPRNHRVEEALDAAWKEGDYGPMHRLLDALSRPYAHTADQAEYAQPAPDDGDGYRTFCGT